MGMPFKQGGSQPALSDASHFDHDRRPMQADPNVNHFAIR
jgi:hypothetical protein